ncbi:hypothetical protein DBV39_04750 [Orrella marina]|uniref:Uncharacterized protein n=1 Tax=Orrella marina TaxID=2163011 RepID=A0A2R4XHB5_9BURK|nr:hypothetical protein [Orrella marina]AWB33134.1 hypothetical protein DBV39_04750 [Orrella marina]
MRALEPQAHARGEAHRTRQGRRDHHLANSERERNRATKDSVRPRATVAGITVLQAGEDVNVVCKDIDTYYPHESVKRFVLDKHFSHVSKKTMAYLATRPGQLKYVRTPKRGW